ncbi:hypothetical protein ACSNOI_40995 [Actinomadura kijaniata]|uniref:hypothetical protein n=1 Tax=Actinomadura kijaniata TaxID=46161 RepID=UPI003F1DF22E
MRRVLAVLGVAILAGAVTACGDEGKSPQAERKASTGSARTQAPQGDGVVATHTSGNLKVEVTGLRRSERFVTLTWNVTVVSGSWNAWGQMSTEQLAGGDVAAVSLIDTHNGKRHRVARSAGGTGDCVCTKVANQVHDPGATVSFHATFAAPPPTVSKVNVDLVKLGAFTDVPIS